MLRRGTVGHRVGLRNRSGLPGEAGLGRKIHGRRTRTARSGRPRSVRQTERGDDGHPAAVAAAGEGPGIVGRTSGARARRPGLRPGQARAAERDPGALAVGAVGVRLPSAGLGERRDPRAVRHRGAEGALPATAAERRDHLVLFDDRTAGRFRSRHVRDARRPRRFSKRRLGHQRGEVVFQ